MLVSKMEATGSANRWVQSTKIYEKTRMTLNLPQCGIFHCNNTSVKMQKA